MRLDRRWPSQAGWSGGLAWAATLTAVGVVVVVAVQAGLNVRLWAWEHYAAARFPHDIGNAFRQGRAADAAGSLAGRYQEVYDAGRRGRRYALDYPPARLLIARTWYRWLEQQEPGIRRWRNERELTWPLLWLNVIAELTTAVALFMLVWQWVRRWESVGDAARPGRGPPLRRIGLGLLAALALWFNPALIFNAHVWPQWDAWLLPFMAGALVAATGGRFLLAGLLVVGGAMLKGQILLGAPVLLVWPLMQRDWAAAGRFVLGVASGFVLGGLVWLAPDRPDRMVVVGAVLLSLAAAGLRVRWPVRDGRWVMLACIALIVSGVVGAIYRDDSFAWFAVGFGGGYPSMYKGTVGNLPALMSRFGWRYDDIIELPLLGPWPLRTFLWTCYGVGLVLCGFAAARQARRGDRRVLISLVLPWALMFALLMQMHERYLVYAAALSACWIAVGVGPALLHLGFTAIAWICIFTSMSRQAAGARTSTALLWRDTAQTMSSFIPGIGWALLVMVLVGLYLVLAPRGGARPRRGAS